MERDKFLTEAMGECWDVYGRSELTGKPYKCSYCNSPKATDFSTWQGFGKLWEWAQEQEWRLIFKEDIDNPFNLAASLELINPDRFANAVYEFLKERNNDL